MILYIDISQLDYTHLHNYFVSFRSGSMGKVLATWHDLSSVPKAHVKDMYIYNTSPRWWQDRGESLGLLLTSQSIQVMSSRISERPCPKNKIMRDGGETLDADLCIIHTTYTHRKAPSPQPRAFPVNSI